MTLEKAFRQFAAIELDPIGVEFFSPPTIFDISFAQWGKGGRFGTLEQNANQSGYGTVETPDKIPAATLIVVPTSHGMEGTGLFDVPRENTTALGYQHGSFLNFSIPFLREEEKSRETQTADAEDDIPNGVEVEGIEGMSFALHFDPATFIKGKPEDSAEAGG